MMTAAPEAAIREIVGDNNSDMKISVMADVGRCDYKKDIQPPAQPCAQKNRWHKPWAAVSSPAPLF